MKNIFVLILAATLLFFACEEAHPPFVPATIVVDESTSEIQEKQAKVILLEEFTGVRCANCPRGARHAEAMAENNPNRLQIVSIHTGIFANPYPGDPNLEIDEGAQLETFLGGTAGFPSASVNRKLHDGNGEDIILLGEPKWTSAFNSDVLLETPVNIDLEITLDDYLEGNIRLDMHFTEDVSGITKFSVIVLENDVIATQDDDGVIVEDYKHKHLLRSTLTQFDGNILKQDAKAGDTFKATIPFLDADESWNLNNIEIVAFVHKSGADKSVLHVGHKKLID